MAAVAFLRFILWSVASLASLFSFLLIRAVAILVVVAVNFSNMRSSFGQATGVLRGLLEQLLSVVGDVLASTVSNVLELVTRAAAESVNFTASASREVVEKLWAMVEEMAEVFPEVCDGIKEMAGKMVDDLWEHCKDGVGFVMENI